MTPASDLPQFKFIGFSGHRDLRDPALVAKVLAGAVERIRATGAKAEWIGISSVASGADTLFVDTVVTAGLAWHAILPLPKHEFREDFSPADWLTVEKLIGRAEAVFQVAPTEERVEAYLDAGLETVDRCDVLVAVWDGLPSRGKGGTAEIVTYAREIGRPLLLIDPATGAVTEERAEAFGKTDPLIDQINALPLPARSEEWPADRPASLSAFLLKADHSASAGAPHFRRLVGGTVILHVLATLIAVTAIVYHLHWVGLPWIKLICLVGALVVAFTLSKSHAHHRWLRHRISAEVSRSAMSAWGLHNGMSYLEEIHVAELSGMIRSIQMLSLRARSVATHTLADFKAVYLAIRVENQMSYYRRREQQASLLLKRLRVWFWIATVAAIACTAVYAAAATVHAEGVPESVRDFVFYLCPVVFPVVAAGCLSFISINDLQRRVASYREMQAVLDRSRRQLAATHSWNAVAKVVRATEEDLLHEVIEWHSIARYSESH
jgi:hypothetical protein